MSWGQLVEEVSGVRVCEVVREGKRYQAEVQLLENKDAYIHVAITVDDGSLPASIIPATHTFIRQKQAV
jgi:hypothetical protein